MLNEHHPEGNFCPGRIRSYSINSIFSYLYTEHRMLQWLLQGGRVRTLWKKLVSPILPQYWSLRSGQHGKLKIARPYQGYLRWLSLKPKSLCLEANVENLHDDEEFEKYLPMAWATTLFSSFFYLIQRILLILNYSGELRLFKAFVEFSDNISYFFYIILHNFVGCTWWVNKSRDQKSSFCRVECN